VDRLRMFFFVVMLCGALFYGPDAVCTSWAEENPSAGEAVPPHVAQQSAAPATKQDAFSTTLDRLNDSNQKKYLEDLKNINRDLREQYGALVRNYGAYRTNFMRMKTDIERGMETPGFILKNLGDIEANRPILEKRIRELEKKKQGLRAEALAFYGGTLPEGLSRQWTEEEEAYRNDIDAVYRKIGWWLGMEYSPLWRNDETLFWNNIQEYYRGHPQEGSGQ
jgi:hypothetical protein